VNKINFESCRHFIDLGNNQFLMMATTLQSVWSIASWLELPYSWAWFWFSFVTTCCFVTI